ncbi:MAG: Mu transposase C-terminal domain-containing protein [Candidatus Gastranaerophilales bacterium]|nr:Mu transposase C-terminal domain-containing protein [Candidatus Gastranaerophilales bacterium]
MMNEEKYITIKELAELKGVSTRAIRLSKSKYITREITVKGGKSFEILLSSIEPELQEKYYSELTKIIDTKKLLPAPLDFHKPDKAKIIALARLDLLNLWKKERKNQSNKTKFDNDFLSTYNTQVLYPEIYAKLGKVSIGTLQRWKRILGNSNNYELLIPNYHYEDYSRTCLTEYEKQIFLKLLLHPNKFSIGKAISLTRYVLKTQGAEYIPAPSTFRRFANWYKANYFDKWTLLRDGEKALKEQVIPHIKRDVFKIEVGEVLVADGKRLNFQVINPFTGKPCRATLIGFLDWKSTALVGYEIMLEENTQNIASALRNAILNLGKIPKFVYLDNGRAFRGKYFMGSTKFDEIGLNGIYEKLGITTVFTNPYNARAKVIERFFLEMQESFEKLLPSYIGTSIEKKPARLKRNEKFHKEVHQNFIPTIQQTVQMINSWLEYKNSLPCPNNKSKTIQEMFDSIERQEINPRELDDLMLAQEIKTITSQGIRFLKSDYYNDTLYGLRQKAIIKYSLFDLSYINVYTTSGKFLCKAERITLTHPLVHYTGEIKDIEDYKHKIKKQKQLKNKTIRACKKILNVEDLGILECHIEDKEDHFNLPIIPKIEIKKEKPEKYNPAVKPLFKTSRERYECLMEHGCTCNDDRIWLTAYKESKEFKDYETQIRIN